ncbi:MAG: hypothetical protein JXA21_13865 [Anaerolineae bacterium]|nr:hypothetical protein [Anaerolineae bacterium]
MKSKVIVLATLFIGLFGVGGWAAQRAYRAGWTPPGIQPSGPTPTPDALFYATKPKYPFWMNEETRKKKREEWETDLQTRVQTLYECSDCGVFYEMVNPLFTQAFPQAQLYEVGIRYQCTEFREEKRCMNRMASLKGKDYRLPDQFNELMHDADYKLTDKNFDRLAYALIVVSVPTGVAMQPIICESKDIQEPVNPDNPVRWFTHEIRCRASYSNLDIVVKFPEIEGQFTSWELSAVDESGKHVFWGTYIAQPYSKFEENKSRMSAKEMATGLSSTQKRTLFVVVERRCANEIQA